MAINSPLWRTPRWLREAGTIKPGDGQAVRGTVHLSCLHLANASLWNPAEMPRPWLAGRLQEPPGSSQAQQILLLILEPCVPARQSLHWVLGLPSTSKPSPTD